MLTVLNSEMLTTEWKMLTVLNREMLTTEQQNVDCTEPWNADNSKMLTVLNSEMLTTEQQNVECWTAGHYLALVMGKPPLNHIII